MALSDTGRAIGSVSRLLQEVLTNALHNVTPPVSVTVARPEPGPGSAVANSARLNLFLYEVQMDAALRNVSLTPGRPAPLWLVLHYVLTAFDINGDSDTEDAHDLLGEAMQALQALSSSGALTQGLDVALIDNPESLRVTFDDGTPDLLSRLMQGPDDRYRTSVPFEIRPILVATGEPPSSMQLVGVNYQTNTIIGLKGVDNILLPTLGPRIDTVSPAQVQAGDTLTITGTGLGTDGIAVQFGSVVLPVSMQQPGQIQCVVGGDPTQLSPGNQAVAVQQTLSNGKIISSNSQSVDFLPTLATATLAGPEINLTGQCLGRAQDYMELGFLNNSGVVAIIDRHATAYVPPADQSAYQFTMLAQDVPPAGIYTVVYRVNGKQAKQAPLLKI